MASDGKFYEILADSKNIIVKEKQYMKVSNPMTLDEKKAEQLYYEIAKDSYGFSSSGEIYYPLVASLDRLKECVKILNNTNLEGKYNEDTTAFVLWVNYADLLIACIENIAKLFEYTVQYENDFQKYHRIVGKTDKDFFRFIRAIVLPHALRLDDNRQKIFTQGKTAYCPYTVWDTKGSVRIVYYINSPSNDLHQYTIQIIDLQRFLKKIYDQIDVICICVVKKKKRLENRRKGDIKNVKYNTHDSILKKCQCLIEITKKYGDLDDKNEVSTDVQLLRRCEKICGMRFWGKNKQLYNKYMYALNIALDDYYDNLTEDRTGEIYLEQVLLPFYSYDSSSSFPNCGYAINKIVAEMEDLDSYYEKYDFPNIYDEVKSAMGDIAYFKKDMSMERVCILTLMVQFFDKLHHNKKYIELNKKYYGVSN